MLYTFYELTHAALAPARAAARTAKSVLDVAGAPLNDSLPGRTLSASLDLFEAVTRQYGKPEWGLNDTTIADVPVPVTPTTVWSSSWCDLVHFRRDAETRRDALGGERQDPKVLIVAPMSGHHATLLRGTARAFLPEHEVYITDWVDARRVPIWEGRFGFDDYVKHVMQMLRVLGPQTHVIGVCQPGPAVLAAVALLAEQNDPARPATMSFMGSPIDARQSPTEPNRLAEAQPLTWFANNMIYTVPAPYPGVLRRVYPGFVQLASFMNMNWDRHVDAHWTFFEHLVANDGDGAQTHRKFYDEYLAVMDLTEEFYIETIDRVFQRHLLAQGALHVEGQLVRTDAIADVALMTVEGERDDISGVGQTQAAHGLCVNVPSTMKRTHVQAGVGHYGVFNGRRFRTEIQPRMASFMREFWDQSADRGATAIAAE